MLNSLFSSKPKRLQLAEPAQKVLSMHKMVDQFGKGLHFMHLNVRSIIAKGKFDMLKNQIIGSNIGVVTISETWLSKKIPDSMIELKGYSMVRLDRSKSDKKRGGGLLTYVDENLIYDNSCFKNHNLMCADIELQCLSLKIPNLWQIIVINIYRPPQGSFAKFVDYLSDTISNIKRNANSELYILGDFNVDMLDKTSQNSKDLLRNMKFFGCLPQINVITRQSTHSSCIDQIFTNSDLISESGVINLNTSDHLAVYCSRKKTSEKSPKKAFTGRSYRNYIKEDFQDAIINSDWATFYTCTDPIKCWDIMETIIRTQIDITCPVKSFKVTASRDPWITNEILEEIRDKDLALQRARRTGKGEHWSFARNEHNRVGRLVELARKDFFEEEERNSRGDLKRFWRNVTTSLPSKRSNNPNISLQDPGTNTSITTEDTASHINDFFANIGTTLAQNFDHNWTPNYPPNLDSEISVISTDFEEIHNLCKEINVSKSSAIELLSSKILKDAFLVLTLQLVYLFNLSLGKGIFPPKWKIATVIPLFKGGLRSNVGNYRPISLLPLPGKMLDKVVHSRLSTFLEDNDLLCDGTIWLQKRKIYNS